MKKNKKMSYKKQLLLTMICMSTLIIGNIIIIDAMIERLF